MALYLVEVYLPRSGVDQARASSRRIRAAVQDVASDDSSIRYLRTTFLPDDETCFHLLEASSAETVARVATRAALGRTRVVAVVDTSDPNGESRT